jgi:hypothetical protein
LIDYGKINFKNPLGSHFCYVPARTLSSEPLRSAVLMIPVIQKIIIELLAQKMFNLGWERIESVLEEFKRGTESCFPLGRLAEVPVNKVMETIGPVVKNRECAGQFPMDYAVRLIKSDWTWTSVQACYYE